MDEVYANMEVLYVKADDGKLQTMEHDDITALIFRALKYIGNNDRLIALNLADKVMYRISTWQEPNSPISITDIESMAKFVLFESGYSEASKYFSDNKKISQFNLG